jgi:HEAT repeat protein
MGLTDTFRMQWQENHKGKTLRRLTAAVVILGCAITFALLAIRHGQGEPRYKDRNLSEWVTLNARKGVGNHGGDDPEEALRHFGTNALPFLIRDLKYERPRWKIRVWALLHYLPVSRNQQRSWSRAALNDMMRGNDAVSAFQTLGDTATPAIPELSSLMFAAKDEQISRRAMQSLAAIGTPAVPALSRALTNFAAPGSFRDNAVEALAEMELQALPAVPMLIQWLQDTNPAVVTMAITALGELALWPDIVVPALTNKLRDEVVRRDVIEALGSFEKDGSPAIPSLLGFLTDSHPETVAAAASALGDIGDQADIVTPALAKLLVEHSAETVRAAAAASLAQFGERARPALPLLRAALENPNQDVRDSARSVLEAISANDPGTNAAPAH